MGLARVEKILLDDEVEESNHIVITSQSLDTLKAIESPTLPLEASLMPIKFRSFEPVLIRRAFESPIETLSGNDRSLSSDSEGWTTVTCRRQQRQFVPLFPPSHSKEREL